MQGTSSPAATDDRRERFRAQAGSIVAAERGLTPACLIKLADLARQLGLEDDEAQELIHSLGGQKSPPLSPAAKKFQRDVRKTLATLVLAALTPLHEARLLEVAEKKHGLTRAEAEGVIASVAAELGIGRISSDEACATLDAMIADKLGDDDWLDQESRETLHKAAERWGLSHEDVDALVRHRLQATRQAKRRRQLGMQIGIGVGAVAVVALVVLLVRGGLGSKPKPSDPASPESTATTEPGGPGIDRTNKRGYSGTPWWDADLVIAIAQMKSGGRELAQAAAAIAKSDPAERQAAYRQLVSLATSLDLDQSRRRLMTPVIARLHALDPDDASAAVLREALLASLPATDAPLPADPQAASKVRQTALLPADLLELPELTDARRKELLTAVQNSLGVTLAPEATAMERQQKLRAGITQRLFKQLIHAARKEPEQAASSLPFIASFAAQDLTTADAERLEGEFLAAWLTAAGENWDVLQDRLVLYVSACDRANLLRLLDTYQRSTDADLTDLLGRLLLARAGASGSAIDKKAVAAAVRQSLGIGSGVSNATAGERWQRLAEKADDLFAAAKSRAGDQRGQLAQAIQAAWLGNLAIGLAQGESYYPQFDRLIEQEPPQLAPEITAPSEDDPPTSSRPKAEKRGPRPPPPAYADLRRYFEELNRFEQHAPAQRTTFVRGLSLTAMVVPDIAPEQAAALARYLLAQKSDEEQEALEGLVGSFRNWKQLRLAIADGLQASKLKPEQIGRIVGPLLAHSPSETSDRAALKRAILQDVVDSLGDTETPQEKMDEASRLGLLLDDASGKLVELYRDRSRALGAANEDLAGAESPARALAKAIERLIGEKGPSPTNDQWQVRLAVADYLAENDLRRTVFLQGMWLDASLGRIARQRSTQRLAAEKLLAEAAATAPTALAQLRERELASLRLWLLFRAE